MSNGQKIVLKIFGETPEALKTFIKTTLDSYTFFSSKYIENDREDQGKYFVWVTIITPAPTDKADAGAKSTLPQIPLECV